MCHSRTQNLAEITRSADILVAAMAGPLRYTDMVKPGAVVIDVGINRIPDATKVFVTGDVDAEGLSGVTAALRPFRRRRPHDHRHALKNTLDARAVLIGLA